MGSVSVGLVALACSFGGALLAMAFGPRLPKPHLARETRRVVHLGMGMVATLTALVLGLMVSTANSSFATVDTEVKQISVKLVLLDHVLARYGPESAPVRAKL